jgi:hypothetical protein
MTTHTLPAQDGATRSGARAALPFVALAFTLSWGLWAVALALGGDVADPAVFALYAIGACGPSLATGILRLLGRSGGQRTRWTAVPAWLPVAVLAGTVQSQMGLFTLTTLGFFVAMLPMSVGYWIVTERLRGGVPAAVLVHLTGNIALTFLFAAPSVVGGVTYLATLVVIAAALLATAGPRRS